MLYGLAWALLAELRTGADPAGPVFLSRKGRHLDPSAAWRVVQGRGGAGGPAQRDLATLAPALARLAQPGPRGAAVAGAARLRARQRGDDLEIPARARPSDGAGRFLGM